MHRVWKSLNNSYKIQNGTKFTRFRYRGCRTFFLFPPFPFIAYLDGADRQYDGDNEEEYASDHAGSDGLVFDARRHWELDLLAALVAIDRVSQNAEVVRASAHQVLHCKRQGKRARRISGVMGRKQGQVARAMLHTSYAQLVLMYFLSSFEDVWKVWMQTG